MKDQAYQVKRTKIQSFFYRLSWRFERWYWNKLQPVLSWFYFKYLQDEQFAGSFKMGLRDGIWTFLCGYGIKFSLHIANIWWQIGKRKK